MELDYQSLFSVGGLVGHASYFLLVVSMMMRDIRWLRLLALLSGIAQLAFDAIWLNNPVGVFWDIAFIAVNMTQLCIMAYETQRAVFSPEERDFLKEALPGLDRAQARRLLNLGLWISGEPGTAVTEEGAPVHHLVFLASGTADIHSGGHVIALCRAPSFIGEMTCLTGEPATGTALLSTPSRYLAIEALALRRLVARNPVIRQALEAAFSRNMREKLVMSNRLLADHRSAAAR